jgi:hypothetical protein
MPFDREKAAALLKSDAYTKASPEVRQAIVERLRKEASTDAAPAAAAPANKGAKREVQHTLDAPKVGSKDWAKGKFYTWADRLLPILPAAGSTAGAMLTSESGPGAIGGGIEGGVLGEAARQYLTRKIFNKSPEILDTLPKTPEDKAKQLAMQGIIGGAGEAGARAVIAPLTKLARPFEQSAETVRAAKAGTGMRLTPGEASGSTALKKIETATSHLPGGIGPWERFRKTQAADASRYFTKQITEMRRQGVPPEQLGQAVQQFVSGAQRQVDGAYQAEIQQTLQQIGVNPAASEATAGQAAQRALIQHYREMETGETALYNTAKKHLGFEGRDVTPEEFDRAVGSHTQYRARPSLPLQGWDTEAGQAVNAARNYTRANRPRFDSKLVSAVLKTSRPEALPGMMATASLEDLRAFQKFVPGEVQHQLGESLLSRMAKESTDAEGQVSGKKLVAQLAKLGNDRGRLIYGAERWQQMTAAAERIRGLESSLPQAREAFRTDLMQKIVNSGQPEAVAALFEKASIGDIRALHSALPEPMRRQVSAQVLQGIVERATDPQTKHLGARSIASSIQDLGQGRGRLLFGKQYDAVMEGSRLMDRMKAPGGEAMGQMHLLMKAGAAVAAIGSVAAFELGHGMTQMALLGGGMGAVRVVTAALLNPATTAQTLKILRMVAATGARAVPYAVDAAIDPAPSYKDTLVSPPTP